jgi:hypothetical protein
VPPVDDVHARGRIDERGTTNEHVALDRPAADLFAQPQVPEVRRLGVHQQALNLAAREPDLLQPLHLRDQLGHVFEARLADLIAQRHHLVHVPAAARRLNRTRRQARPHAREQAFFLDGDVVAGVGLGRHAQRLHGDQGPCGT